MFKKILLLLLLFTLIYKPEFIFIPHSVNMFFGIIGILIYIIRRDDTQYITETSNTSIRRIIHFILPFVIVSIVSILINASSDLYYPRYASSLILCYFGTYFFADLFYKVYGEMSVDKLIDYFVIVECIFLFIGLLSFFTPGLYEEFARLQKYNEISLNAMDRTEGSRLISIGAQFFTASVINGLVLMLIGIRFYCFSMSVKTKVLYLIAFIFILVVGMMMGRTTIIGGAIGLALIALSFTQRRSGKTKTIISLAISLAVVFVVYSEFIASGSLDFDVLSEFGFEMFNNYQNGDGFSAHSNERLLDMYNTIPGDLMTWIIGDAKWSEGDHYYMRVDAGYLRGLWYFGIIGLVSLFWYYYRTVKYIIVEKLTFNGKKFIPMCAFIVYIAVLNGKGPTDLFFYIMPFVFCNKCIDYEC